MIYLNTYSCDVPKMYLYDDAIDPLTNNDVTIPSDVILFLGIYNILTTPCIGAFDISFCEQPRDIVFFIIFFTYIGF